MEVINVTKDSVLSENARLSKSFFSILLGLMFSRPADMVLEMKRDSILGTEIHMFFMKFPIDVIWVNSKMKVVDVKKGVPPARFSDLKTIRFYKPIKPAKYVVELGTGKIGNTEIGDTIGFKQ